MDLFRDVLDQRIVDRNGRDLGRVDRLVLGATAQGQPRLVAIEVDEGRPYRIPINNVLSFDDHVTIDVAVGDTPAATVEHRLRRWFTSIPGSR